MRKIGFIIPWYDDKIPGGAESALRGLVKELIKSGINLEILTTCVKEFSSDWSVNYHKPGMSNEAGVVVRRFKVRARNQTAFDNVNSKLMQGILISGEEEKTFIEEMVNSPDLYEYIKENKNDYSLFVPTPYMFGPSYYCAKICPEKTVLIPCFHDEAYAYMDIYNKIYNKILGMVFLSRPEKDLAYNLYGLESVKTEVIGTGLETDLNFEGDLFRRQYGINYPYILYAGRKDAGKNIYLLLEYFKKYKQRTENNNNLKLLLIGGGKVDIPLGCESDIIDLGFLPIKDKYNAYEAAELLCQPSKNESFSIVIMESWLAEKPVLVNGKCAVTRNFAVESNAGLYFDDYCEFEGCVNYILGHKAEAVQMGINGRKYVKDNFDWKVVAMRYLSFFKEVLS